MKGLLRLKPPKTQLFPNWDLVTVLEKLVSWGDIKQLSLLQLLRKTAFLVAVVCYKRPAVSAGVLAAGLHRVQVPAAGL